MPDFTPSSVGIIGLGLIGSSVALAARRRWPAIHVAGVDRPARLLHETIAHVCDIASPDVSILSDADIVVLATPVDVILQLLPALAGLRRPAGLVMDTGSTKRAIMAGAARAGLTTFIGGHPMAGGTESGPTHARGDLFDARAWFLVDPQAPADLRDRAHAFVDGLGAIPVPVEADWHDRVMAAGSHLPQMTASLLMKVVGEALGEDELHWSGTGLRDTTRLAASSASTWESVLATNHDFLKPLLVRLAEDLLEMAGRLHEPEAVSRVFEAANRWKAGVSELPRPRVEETEAIAAKLAKSSKTSQ